jgi:phosphopantetheinyl transferase
MSPAHRGSSKSDSGLWSGGVTLGTTAKGMTIERRSPNRPEFVAGWRKTIGRNPSEAELGPDAQQIDHIDIWLAHPDCLLRAHSCLKLLTQEDWAVLGRIRDTSIRQSAMATRILLRLGLSRAVDRRIAPADWQFKTVAHGKPTVADDFPEIKFNVSHVDRLAAVAISPHLEIGIDVESVDQNVSEDVVAGFSHSDEKTALRNLLPRQKVREFIRLWTFKEAFTKMIGTGISLDFNTIQFMLDPVQLESVGDSRKEKRSTHFESIYVSIEHSLYHVSLAIEHPEGRWLPTEVRIISLAEPKGASVPSCAPEFG